MQLLPIFVAIALGLLALVFVLYPLSQRNLTKEEQSITASTTPSTENKESRMRTNAHIELPTSSENAALENEQAAKNAIQEVELDYQLGNISESDYHSLRERYLRRAVVAMKSRYDREQELDDERTQ